MNDEKEKSLSTCIVSYGKTAMPERFNIVDPRKLQQESQLRQACVNAALKAFWSIYQHAKNSASGGQPDTPQRERGQAGIQKAACGEDTLVKVAPYDPLPNIEREAQLRRAKLQADEANKIAQGRARKDPPSR